MLLGLLTMPTATPTKLTEVETVEVSVVPAGMNGRTVAVTKENRMSTKPLELEDVVKACEDIVAELDLDEVSTKRWDTLLKADNLDEKQTGAVKAALRLLAALPKGVGEGAKKELASMVGYGYPAPAAKQDPPVVPPVVPPATPASFMKADGSLNVDAIPAEIRPIVEGLWKASEANKLRADAAETIAKAEREARLTKEFADKAATLTSTPGDVKERAEMLKALYVADPAMETKVFKSLQAADALLKQSQAFGVLGADGSGPDSPEGKLDSLAKEYAKTTKVTFEKAYSEILRTPEGAKLYAETLTRN